MAKRHLVLQNRKSILGAALVGLGLFILLRNAHEAASLGRSLRTLGNEADTLGILTSATMVVRQSLQAYFFHHAEFLGALHQALLSFSGLLLVVTGTAFFAVVFAGSAEKQKKEEGHVDFAGSHSTSR